jgi:RNA polymerase sigma factor (sigma-70 family)
MDDVTLTDLVAAAQAGGHWAFERVYSALAPAVTGYLRAQGSAEPEDRTSEVFLAAFRGLDGFTGDGAAFRSWLFTIAHRRLVDERRRASRRPATRPLDDNALRLAGGDVGDDAMAGLGSRRVLELLNGLAPDQRDVLVLRIVADLTVAQVAEVLGKSGGAVKALQRRGLAALRKEISLEGVPL